MADRDFFDVMKETLGAMAPGLKNLGAEVGVELERLGTQGQMELANALFNGSAFVPYGPGQYTPSLELDQASQQNEMADQNLERERGGRDM